MFGYSTYDAGSAIDCGTFSPWSAAIAALIVTATWAGPGPAGDRDHRMPRVEERAHGTGRAALHIDAGEILVDGDRVGGRLLRRAVIPLADHPATLDLLGGVLQDLVK